MTHIEAPGFRWLSENTDTLSRPSSFLLLLDSKYPVDLFSLDSNSAAPVTSACDCDEVSLEERTGEREADIIID